MIRSMAPSTFSCVRKTSGCVCLRTARRKSAALAASNFSATVSTFAACNCSTAFHAAVNGLRAFSNSAILESSMLIEICILSWPASSVRDSICMADICTALKASSLSGKFANSCSICARQASSVDMICARACAGNASAAANKSTLLQRDIMMFGMGMAEFFTSANARVRARRPRSRSTCAASRPFTPLLTSSNQVSSNVASAWARSCDFFINAAAPSPSCGM